MFTHCACLMLPDEMAWLCTLLLLPLMTLWYLPSVGLALGPSYSVICKTDQDCGLPGMSCYYDYVGCHVGTCGCMYGTREGGTCLLKKEGDLCSSHDQCPRGLNCHNSKCTCTGQLIDNGLYCKKSYEVLLGSECVEGQICLQKSEDGKKYASSDVLCNRGYCTCRRGLKQDGATCRRLRPDERGCLTSVDCSGDSICKNQYCRCPRGFKVVTYEPRKCGRWNAITDLAEGQVCDEFLEKNRFCASNLQCVACGDDVVFRCRKYKSTRPEGFSSSQRPLANTRLVYILSVTRVLLKTLQH